MIRIIPAILVKTTDELRKQLTALTPFFSHFQIDIADGAFVTNKTIQLEHIAHAIKNDQLITNNLTFDFHLMVNQPMRETEKIFQLPHSFKVSTVFFHVTVFTKLKCTTRYTYGLVLNPEDNIEAHWEIIQQFPAVQIMSVNPGFQGAPFLPETLKKINQLRKKEYEGKIYLDGGINDKTLLLIMKNNSTPDVVCVGSYLHKDRAQRLKLMQSLISPTIT